MPITITNVYGQPTNQKPSYFSRRDFIATTASACMAFTIPAAAMNTVKGMKKAVKVGVITDLHQDIMHDGPGRMQAFVQHMKKVRPDAILQMGDFAIPADKNKSVIDLFNQAHSNRLHVIGNHDTDGGFTKDQCISAYGMPGRYYTQKVDDITFIVLDGNDKGSPTYKEGYPSFINAEQSTWLKEKLASTNGPIVVVSHQPLAGPAAVDNATEIQDILSTAADKILVAINGHTHIDAQYQVKDIYYVHLNSASYFWIGGGKYSHESYAKDIIQAHPLIASTCPYKDALFTTMTIDPLRSLITFEGRKSEWVGQSPEALGYDGPYQAASVTPSISGWKILKRGKEA
ncbi:metallophosphoesterase family protein [Paraflavitalea speifideaquila]|uniref:metallophosphoesterase family protein n=1 Tax=Paraflavitalea speifideaquila TaxID=3076558 RepID=UPI0028EE842D|nr:metallophosphoesterase [Paraflavitalea speifideiaquila]